MRDLKEKHMLKRNAAERPQYITLAVYLNENQQKIRITLVSPQGDETPLSQEPPAPTSQTPEPTTDPTDIEMIPLPKRDWYVWQRYGGLEAVLPMIVDPERCAQCDEEHRNPQTTNGWFCLACQRTLQNLGQLPEQISTAT